MPYGSLSQYPQYNNMVSGNQILDDLISVESVNTPPLLVKSPSKKEIKAKKPPRQGLGRTRTEEELERVDYNSEISVATSTPQEFSPISTNSTKPVDPKNKRLTLLYDAQTAEMLKEDNAATSVPETQKLSEFASDSIKSQTIEDAVRQLESFEEIDE